MAIASHDQSLQLLLGGELLTRVEEVLPLRHPVEVDTEAERALGRQLLLRQWALQVRPLGSPCAPDNACASSNTRSSSSVASRYFFPVSFGWCSTTATIRSPMAPARCELAHVLRLGDLAAHGARGVGPRHRAVRWVEAVLHRLLQFRPLEDLELDRRSTPRPRPGGRPPSCCSSCASQNCRISGISWLARSDSDRGSSGPTGSPPGPSAPPPDPALAHRQPLLLSG